MHSSRVPLSTFARHVTLPGGGLPPLLQGGLKIGFRPSHDESHRLLFRLLGGRTGRQVFWGAMVRIGMWSSYCPLFDECRAKRLNLKSYVSEDPITADGFY